MLDTLAEPFRPLRTATHVLGAVKRAEDFAASVTYDDLEHVLQGPLTAMEVAALARHTKSAVRSWVAARTDLAAATIDHLITTAAADPETHRGVLEVLAQRNDLTEDQAASLARSNRAGVLAGLAGNSALPQEERDECFERLMDLGLDGLRRAASSPLLGSERHADALLRMVTGRHVELAIRVATNSAVPLDRRHLAATAAERSMARSSSAYLRPHLARGGALPDELAFEYAEDAELFPLLRGNPNLTENVKVFLALHAAAA